MAPSRKVHHLAAAGGGCCLALRWRVSMDAEQLKSLTLAWVSAAELAYSHLAGRREQLASDEAQAELYAAIDAMQAEIDRLRTGSNRYEKVRTMSVNDFIGAYVLNLKTNKPFDQIADEWSKT